MTTDKTWKTYSIFSKTSGQRVWRGDAVSPERALWAAGRDGVAVAAETHDVWETGSYEEARAEQEAKARAEQLADEAQGRQAPEGQHHFSALRPVSHQ